MELVTKPVENIIKGHPQFEVHFSRKGRDIVQNIDASQPIAIKQSNLSKVELEKYNMEFVKPFKLREGLMYLMDIVTTKQDVYLLTDVHHLSFIRRLFRFIPEPVFVADENAVDGSLSPQSPFPLNNIYLF